MKQLNWYQIFGKSNIPDGRTVLPTDDIQIWLHCANIWDKTYTTLAEVLADTTILAALIASNNAVDYMVRSTTWAVEISVPELTGATDKATGVADAWKAFQTNESNGAQVAPGDRVIYEFDNPICVIDYHQPKVSLGLASATYTYKIQGSNDKVTWVDLATDTVSNWVDGIRKPLTTSGLYRYVALYCDSQSGGSGHYVLKINFYSASITDNATAMSYIGLNNYCANTLLADSTWKQAIIESTYRESVLNVKAIYMTGNSLPTGEVATASSVYNNGNDQPYRAFDNDSDLYWSSAINTDTSSWIKRQSSIPIKIIAIYISVFRDSESIYRCRKFALKGSNNGNDWTQLLAQTTLSDSMAVSFSTHNANFILPITNSTSYDYFLLDSMSSDQGNHYIQIAEIQFYGREDV